MTNRIIRWWRERLRQFVLDSMRPHPTDFSRCGANVRFKSECRIFSAERMCVGDDVYIGPGAWIDAQGGITIGNGTIVGPRVRIYSASHNFRSDRLIPYDEAIVPGPVSIGENCWIGGDVLFVPGASIGEGCVVGAGAVVAGVHARCGILIGNPAKAIGSRDGQSYDRLKAAGRIYLRTRGHRDARVGREANV